MLEAIAIGDYLLHGWLTAYRAAWLDDLMLAASDLGARGFVWVCAALILFVYPSRRAGAWRLLLAIGFTLLVVEVALKPYIMRVRPFDIIPDVVVIAAKPTTSSFPSGHAASAVAGMIAATRVVPEARVLWVLLALAIAYSRVYVGVHFPLDVLAGALLGTLCAWFVLGGRVTRLRRLPPAVEPTPPIKEVDRARRASERTQRMTEALFASNREAARHDKAYWKQLPAHERVLLAWKLSEEQWALKAVGAGDEPRLPRSVERIRRR